MSGIVRYLNRFNNIYSLIVLALVFILGFACGDSKDNDAPVIYDLNTPDFIPIGFSDTVYLYLTVDDNQGLDDVKSVFFVIQNPDSTIRSDTSYMNDDGLTGDVTNGDGIYTFGATLSNTPQDSGDYRYIFAAIDSKNSMSETLDKVISIGESTNPYIYDLSIPEYIQIGFPETYPFTVKVSDPQGLSDIDKVFFIVEDPQGVINTADTSFMLDDGLGDDELADDGVYTYTMSDHGSYTIEGDYIFYFYTTDMNDSLSNELVDTLTIDNRVNPYVYDLVAPDSLRKGSSSTSFLSVRLWDPQGMDNIDSVYFWVLKPDGSTNGTFYPMYDDGEVFASGDSVANDSIYSRGILPPSEDNQSGVYTFYFTAVDLQSNEANTLSKQIIAYDPAIYFKDDFGEYNSDFEVPDIWK